MKTVKRILAIILILMSVVLLTACAKESDKNYDDSDVSVTEGENTVANNKASIVEITDEIKNKMDNRLEDIDFEGIVYLTHNGEVIYQSVTGEDEKGNELTVESPMFVGSVSKQFCATAIMMLKEQGKLSVDDTLDKYFPDYKYGKDITIKNLLTMRSGITDLVFAQEPTPENSDEEILDSLRRGILGEELLFTPDSKPQYANSNYFLLGDIVCQVSGVSYNEFIRENIFKPLSMNDSGFVSEVKESPEFSKHLTLDTLYGGEVEAIVARGAGDIVTTAPDMEKWMSGLSSGKLISKESFAEMTTDYSPDAPVAYGYALQGSYRGGVSHTGLIGSYTALDYINVDDGINLFVAINEDNKEIETLPWKLIENLIIEEN